MSVVQDEGYSVESPEVQKKFMPDHMLCGVNTLTCASFLINKKVFTIGRDADCDAVIDFSREIDGRHAQITIEDGKYYISDLGSTNKTYLNGFPVDQNAKMPFSAGDRIKFSSLIFQVKKLNR